MEFFSPDFFSALAAIVLIDLVLAGDNAIVIALAARSLPPVLQRRAVVWGTLGAIAVRTAMTLVFVWLLMIPGLLLAGGVLLIWIGYKLLVPNSRAEAHVHAASGFWSAMKTIIIADAVMGLDNVLGVAGAAQGSFVLVILGLLISIPIMVWGSTLILKSIERFPIVIYVGAAVLAWTAAKMITSEPLVIDWLSEHRPLHWMIYAAVIGGVLGLGYRRNRRVAAVAQNT